MDRPETCFAWNGEVALAYQVVGDGPIDLVYCQGFCSHVDLNWESRHLSRFLKGLAKHHRLIATDRRGWGCSDRFSPTDVPPIETLADDLVVVMDAAGSERAGIFCSWETTLIAALFAASHPERTAGLILCDGFAAFARTEDTPRMAGPDDWEHSAEEVRRDWGTTRYWPFADPVKDEWWARFQRSSVAPGSLVAETRRFLDTDVRAVLPSIHVPTLVIADRDGQDKVNSPKNGRYLAERIAGAQLVELPGGAPYLHRYARGEAIVREVGAFLAGIANEESMLDRQLASVLFTDIVGSTDRAAALGDRAWRELVERHHATIRSLLARYQGTEVDTAGDGFFAAFDGPARAVRCAQAIAEAVKRFGIEVGRGSTPARSTRLTARPAGSRSRSERGSVRGRELRRCGPPRP